MFRDMFRDILGTCWGHVSEHFRNIFGTFSGHFRDMFRDMFRYIFGTFSGHVRDIFGNIFGTCSGHFRDIFGTMLGTFPGHFRDIFGTFSGHFRDIFGIFSGTCSGPFRDLFGTCFRDIFGILSGNVFGTFSRHVRDIFGTFSGHVRKHSRGHFRDMFGACSGTFCLETFSGTCSGHVGVHFESLTISGDVLGASWSTMFGDIFWAGHERLVQAALELVWAQCTCPVPVRHDGWGITPPATLSLAVGFAPREYPTAQRFYGAGRVSGTQRSTSSDSGTAQLPSFLRDPHLLQVSGAGESHVSRTTLTCLQSRDCNPSIARLSQSCDCDQLVDWVVFFSCLRQCPGRFRSWKRDPESVAKPCILVHESAPNGRFQAFSLPET